MNILTGDGVGKYVRHGLTLAAGALVYAGYLDASNADEFGDQAFQLITQAELLIGLLVGVVGVKASAENKKR